jgi:hypothetical protein
MIQNKHLTLLGSLLVIISISLGQNDPRAIPDKTVVTKIKKCSIDTLKMDSIIMQQNETQRLLKQMINK